MKKILIVDDDALIIEFLATVLKQEGYEVEQAFGGEQGFRMAVELRPDLMILDLMLPDMHGFDVCQSVQADGTFADMKILISSAKGYEVDRKAAMRMGASGYLNKPFSSDALLTEVHGLIGKP